VSETKPTVIVRRKKVVVAHGHNSAWKIAFADFATAMMAFFLVLWLTEATTLEEQRAISSYFIDPVGFEEGGHRYIVDFGAQEGRRDNDQVATIDEAQKIIDAQTVEQLAHELEQQQFDQLANKIQSMIMVNDALGPYQEQVDISVTPEGLQIQILDQEKRPMFDKGSEKLNPHFVEILGALALTIQDLPNRISISGHTDASTFVGRQNYSNWELSSERANAARRVLQNNGIDEAQIARVVGMGSSNLYLPDDPLNPVNRRISILVLSKSHEEKLQSLERGEQSQSPELKLQPAVDSGQQSTPEQGRDVRFDFDSTSIDSEPGEVSVGVGTIIEIDQSPEQIKQQLLKSKEIIQGTLIEGTLVKDQGALKLEVEKIDRIDSNAQQDTNNIPSPAIESQSSAAEQASDRANSQAPSTEQNQTGEPWWVQ